MTPPAGPLASWRAAHGLPRFGVVYADPPWRYAFSLSKKRRIERQYPTMALEDICALDVRAITDDDCLLYLWGVAPKLPEALLVLTAWGFSYLTMGVWDKQRIGMGYYFRGQHEYLLVGKKGSPRAPAPPTRRPSVVSLPRPPGGANNLGKHSAKPREFRDMLTEQHPSVARIELFARESSPGWSVWGNQAPG